MSTVSNNIARSFTYENNESCPWRVIRNGLIIEGLCKNSACPAYNQMVVINLGFGEFDFARIILQRHNECPICNTQIEPIKYALNNCRWWYVNHYSTDSFPLHTVHDTYELFNLTCEYKILETMPLLQNYMNTVSQETACPICLMNIESDGERFCLACAHSFHRTCIHGWFKSNQTMSNTCPMCREHIIK